jgi:hypothetical protein
MGQPRNQLGGFGKHLVERLLALDADLGFELAPLVGRQAADLEQAVDEQAQAHLGRQPSGRGVGGIDEARRLQIRQGFDYTRNVYIEAKYDYTSLYNADGTPKTFGANGPEYPQNWEKQMQDQVEAVGPSGNIEWHCSEETFAKIVKEYIDLKQYTNITVVNTPYKPPLAR